MSKDSDKDVEAKKIPYFSLTNSSYNNRQTGQSSQTTTWPNKKDSHFYYDSNKCQPSNTLVIGVNATTLKKNKKIDKNLS